MAANLSNTTLTTKFDVAPYYDDYDIKNQFYRLLYKPGYAVQARELTQTQSLLQNQIYRFGQHIFKEGSRVLGGTFSVENDVSYVKVNDTDTSNTIVNITQFNQEVVTGTQSNIKAYIITTEDTDGTASNTKTLFVRYLSANGVSNTTTFIAGETLTSNVGTVVLKSSSPTGLSTIFTVDEGIWFAKEHFIYSPKQTIVISRYNQTPNCQVGFLLTEKIINSSQDTSLLDPALESSNFSAPGADRLKITPQLVKYGVDEVISSPDYFMLYAVRNGIVEQQYERTQYSVIKEELAKRTFDESGDYYVNGLDIRVREHKDNGVNGGYDANGNTSLLAIGIGPGTAYVKGYEINNLVTKYIPTERAYSFVNVNSQIVSTRYGNYLTLNEFVGAWNLDKGQIVYFYDTAQKRITDKKWSTSSQTGNLIGSAKLKNIVYNSGTLGTSDGKVDVYLMDIQMLGSNSFSNIKSLYYDNSTTADMGGDVVLTSNSAVLQETFSPLIYSVGAVATRSIRDSSGNPDTTFIFNRTTDVSISANGLFNLPITTGASEIFPYGTGTLTTSEKQEIILNINDSASINLTGIVSGTNNTNTITGTGTNFTKLNVGDRFEFSNVSGPSGTYIIGSISSDTVLTTTTNLTANATSNAINKVYKAGDIIDLTGKGCDVGTTRTVSGTSTTLSFDLKETFNSTKSGTVSYRVTRTSAREINKILKPNRVVQINCASAGVNGSYNLGFSDVYKVRQIRKKTGSFSSLTEGTDVTSSFIIDNGQRDDYYDIATIQPKNISLSNTDFLLVQLDYFEPDFTLGVGYFSVDSYPINDSAVSNTTISTAEIPIYKSPTTGIYYDLRNNLDFRPVKSITSNDTTSVSTATVNPTNTNTFTYEGNGLRLPNPEENLIFDYSYYLARIDMVAVDINGNFSIIKGEPSIFPITPKVPTNLMSVAKLNILPYPSLSLFYANLLGRKDLAINSQKTLNIRHTMRDIGVLKQRIENVEKYTLLSSLENETINFRILDDNGLDRFKNGIFVDSFVDYNYSDTFNVDFNIVIDPKEKSIRPTYQMDSFYYDYLSGSNVQKTGDLITLPYTSVSFLEQNKATTIRNIETTVYRFIGNMTLDPENDNWADTTYAPDNNMSAGPTTANTNPVATTWNAWQKKITGYNLSYIIGTPGSQVPLSLQAPVINENYTNIEQAQSRWNQLVSQYTGGFGISLSEIYENTRTGTQTMEGITTSTTELNNTLIDVDLALYIRPQIIKFQVRGLKPGTRYYTFFDGQNMSNYVAQFSNSASYANYPLFTNTSILPGTEGSALISNASGEIFAYIRIPSDSVKFTVGTKEIKVTDSPTNESFATSYATAYFVAQGLIEQKQRNILTTRKIIQTTVPVNQTNIGSVVLASYKVSCMAYSFLVSAPVNEEGLFMTGFDVYVAAKHSTLGIWFELREMDSSGGITTTSVPLSQVWVKSSDITTSTDGSVPLHVDFQAPIFLYNNTQYALVIHTEGINPDYYFYISRLGGTDLITGQQVTARPLTGTLYTTNNNLNFDIVPEQDLKVKFYRASFTKDTVGTAYLGNKSYEFMTVNDTTSPLNRYGERVIGLDRLTLTGNTAVVGDILIGLTSNVNTTINFISGSTYYSNGRGFVVGETVVIANANGTIYGSNAVVSTVENGRGVINKYSSTSSNGKLYVAESNGKFIINDTIIGSLSNTTANVVSLDKLKYSVVDFEPEYITFNNTYCNFQMRTVSNTSNAVSSYFSIVPKDNYYIEDEKVILSRSSELNALSGDHSNQVKITMSTPSTYLSPVVDIARTHSVYVYNMINSNTTNENLSTGGSLINKYISRIVTLAEGQDAEDLSVIISAFRPPATDVKIWTRISHAEDSELIINKDWIELECVSNTSYSSVSKDNFIDYIYKFPDSYMTGTNGTVVYTNENGITFEGYKQFQLKIGLLSDNSAVVPRVASLRTIALQI